MAPTINQATRANKVKFDKVVEQLSDRERWWDNPWCEMNVPWTPYAYMPGWDAAVDRLVIWLDNTDFYAGSEH